MLKCTKIYNHPLYKKRMDIINKEEKDRKFCCHRLEHSLDVARIGTIMIQRDNLNIDIELFYAAALLHDAGRYSGKPHNESGALIAEQIMPECDFTAEETRIVVNAIKEHRTDNGCSEFSRILYTADKKSRMCFTCPAADECYWPEKKRNMEIEI